MAHWLDFAPLNPTNGLKLWYETWPINPNCTVYENKNCAVSEKGGKIMKDGKKSSEI